MSDHFHEHYTHTHHYGWEAAVMTAQFTAQVALDTGANAAKFVGEPSRITTAQLWEMSCGILLIVLWNLPNLLMLATPLL